MRAPEASSACASGAILFVRAREDLPRSLAEATAVLVRRRRALASPADDVLGVWVRERLDAGLVDARGGLVCRESVSIPPVWSLCWFDWTDRAPTTAERRMGLLDALVARALESG